MTDRKINKLSDEVVEDLFTEAFEAQVGSLTDIGEFEAKCVREIGSDEMTIEVTIYGFAGTPTPDDYKAVKCEEFKKVVVGREDICDANFALNAEGVKILNTNDYVVPYVLVD